MPTKGQKMARVTKAMWTKIKNLYVNGVFNGLEDLHRHLEATEKPLTYPSERQLKRVSAREHWWDLKVDQPKKIEEIILKSTIEMFANQGMPKEKAVDICIDGMTSGEKTFEEFKERLLANENLQTIEILDFVKRYNNDRNISLKYLQEYNKMCGNYEPVKKEVEHTINEVQDKEYHKAYEMRLSHIDGKIVNE